MTNITLSGNLIQKVKDNPKPYRVWLEELQEDLRNFREARQRRDRQELKAIASKYRMLELLKDHGVKTVEVGIFWPTVALAYAFKGFDYKAGRSDEKFLGALVSNFSKVMSRAA